MKKFLIFIAFVLLLPNISFAELSSDPIGSFTNVLPPQTTFNGSGPLLPANSVSVGASAAGSLASSVSAVAPVNGPDPSLGLTCSLLDPGKYSECFALIPYYLFYVPATWILAVAGKIFDVFTAYSLSSTIINANFVHIGWAAVRDISNILFIFILLYLAIRTILGLGDWKKQVSMIVITALLINFSLFFTQVMIDASNLVAYQFYNLIGGGSDEVRTNGQNLGIEAHSISTRIISSINPQSLVGEPMFNLWKNTEVKPLGTIVVIFFAGGVIALAFAWVFFWAAFLMLGRLIAFWVLMMFSPIAFIGLILPRAGELLGGSWWGQLTNQLLVAPVFLFFVYILTFILGSGGLFG